MSPSQGDVGEHPSTDGTAESLLLSQSETPYQHNYGYTSGKKRVRKMEKQLFPHQEAGENPTVVFPGRKAEGYFCLTLNRKLYFHPPEKIINVINNGIY